MKEYIIAIIGIALAGIFGKMWWDEKNSERPALPPSFIESQIRQSEFIPLTEQISKVYAVCPTQARIADYLMSWTARVNYSITLSDVKIKEVVIGETKKWIVESPKIKILNEGTNLIDERDHYKFNNQLLILMDSDAQAEHYRKERERAEDIAKYIAYYRIQNDKSLQEIIKSQLKLTALGLISQANDNKVEFSNIEVVIAPNEIEQPIPNRPHLCDAQPFKTNLGLTELPVTITN
ncbi:hypothetical protein [uncultured Psychrosphaera sp.]|uniref:hypothetical protein n=1 Tax=uncultured Psychrosphaera sp. TaxID=1403522 RepID=UPI002626186F|nr:hypothetical protein [uncultured Psychrosphaera sp.]